MFKITTPPGTPAQDDRARAVAESAVLPLEARVEQGPAGPVGSRGWIIRVPVRAERVTVQKRSIVNEEVEVGRGLRDATVHHDAEVHREVVHVNASPAKRGASRV